MSLDLSGLPDDTLDSPGLDLGGLPDNNAKALREQYRATTSTPDDAAKVIDLTKRTGLPKPVVERNRQAVERQAFEPDWGDLETSAPITVREMAANTKLFELAHDDTENLREFERTLNRRSEGQIGGPAFDRSRGEVKASRGPEASFSSITYGLANSFSQGAERARQGVRMQFADVFGLDEMFQDALRKRDQAQSRQDLTTPDFESSTARGLYGGGASTLQNLPGLAASIITRSPTPALAAAGVQTELDAYGKYRSRGASGAEALVGAAGEGAVEVATELIPLRTMLGAFGHPGKTFAKEFLKSQVQEQFGEQAATILQDAIDTAVANPNKTWGEYLKERPDAAYQTALATLVQSGVMTAGHVAVSKMAGDEAQAAGAAKDAEALAQLSQLAAASKLRARDPQSFQDFVAAANEDGAVQDIYIDARTLQQAGIDPQLLAQASPSAAAQIEEALATGSDLVIPMSEYAARIAGTDLDPVLTPHLRTAEDALSLDEAQTFYQGQAEEFQQAAAKVMEEKQADDAFVASAKAVETKLFEQLSEAGRFTDDVNSAYSTLMRDFYVATASRLGITPEEMFARYPLRVAAERMAGEQRMEQGGPTFDLSYTADSNQIREVKVGDTRIVLDANTDVIKVSSVRTPQAKRGKGSARAAMKALVEQADAQGVRLALDASALDSKTSTGKLVKFYESLGFKLTGKTINAVGDPEMVREPQQPLAQPEAPQNPLTKLFQAVTDALGITQPAEAVEAVEQPVEQAAPAGPALDVTQFFQADKPDLIVQHNLSAENLLHAFKMGGIPVPSLAITKKDHPLTGFGEITLLGSKDLADPKGYAGTKVFGADIYSPRYPSVKYQFTANMQKRAEAMLKDGIEATGKRIDWDEWERRGVEGAQRTVPLMWKFLKEQGVEPTIVRKEVKPLPASLQPFINDNRFTHELAADPAFVEASYKVFEDQLVAANGEGYRESAKAEIADLKKNAADRGVSYLVNDYARQVNQFRMDSAASGTVDAGATGQAIEAQVQDAGLRDEFNDYAREFFADINPNERIFQGYTNNGRRYVAHTLENVVKILKKELRGGEGFNYGVGSIRSAFTPQFKSIKQIREAKDRLMDKAAFEAVKDEIDKEFFALTEQLAPHHAVGKEFGFGDTASSMMYDAAKMGIPRALKENGFSEVPDEAQREIATFLGKLRDLPTEYFEAKILRDVDLTEFSGAVVPEGVNPKVIEALNARGIKDIRTYKKGDDADRRAKIGEFENLFFQGNRGEIAFGRDITQNPSVITLFNNADLSTFLHEMGHFQLEVLAHIASQPNAPAEIVQDMERVLAWFGITGSEEVGGGEAAGSLGQPGTDAFDKWFGGSKVVDAQGKPLISYHSGSFNENEDGGFNTENGVHFGTKGAALERIVGKAIDDEAMSAEVFEEGGRYYLDENDWPNAPESGFRTEGDARTWIAGEVSENYQPDDYEPDMTAVYLNIKNPKRVEDQGQDWSAAIAQAKAEGYDGIVYRNKYEDKGSDSWIVFEPTQIKSVNNRGTFDPNDANILNQPAYHGSPYRFDKFSLEHLGKGEGAQAYGWGLYFAGKKGIADHYRQVLSKQIVKVDGKKVATIDWNKKKDREKIAKALGFTEKRELDDAQTLLRGFFFSGGKWDYVAQEVAEYSDYFRPGYEAVFERMKGRVEFDSKGQLYEVNIPDEGSYLLWDKPLSEQPEGVKAALNYIGKPGAFSVRLPKEKGGWVVDFDADKEGKRTYAALVKELGSDEAASKYLNSLGIAGIKYLDSTSRSAGDGSFNYVIFDDTAVEILNTYYQGDDQTAPNPDALPKRRTALEVWQAMSLEEKRPYHEQFARGFESYLFEGKAPNPELNSLFRRFADWLKAVYKSIKALNVEISPELRGVFDRMIATEDAIRQAEEQRGYTQQFTDDAEANAAASEATATAIEQLQRRSLRDMRWLDNARGRLLKQMQTDAKAKRKAVEAEVRAEVEAMPIYAVQRFLKRGEMTAPDGEQVKVEKGHRLDTAALAEMYPETMLARPALEKLQGMTRKEGLHPDLVAEMFGFTSGDQLVREIIAAEPKAQLVEGLTDQRVLERYGDLSNPDTIARAVDEAIHNEARARFVATELKAIGEAMTPVRAMMKAAKDFAAATIARKKVRDIKPNQHAAAETRAAKAATKAMKAGDTATAVVEKRNQLVQNYSTRAAYDALDEIDKAVKYLRKFDSEGTRKNLDTEYVDQIDQLLERFDLRASVSNKAADKRANLLAWVESQRDQGFEPDIPPELLTEALRKPYRELTLEELRGLVDTVKQIEHLGRLKQKLLTAKDEREFKAIRDEIAASIEANAKGTRDLRTRETTGAMLAEAGNRFLAMHRKMASVAREMDGFADGGPMWEYFIRSMNEAGDRETTRRAEATARLYALVKPLVAQGKMGGKGQYFETLGGSYNREERIAIALNLGNVGNMQRMLDGEGWTMTRLQPLLATITPEEADFVQAVWDFFESYRPEIAAKERRIYGKEPNWVEPQPITLGGKTLKGGYYPIKYDPARSGRAEAFADAEAAKAQMRGAYTTATTRRSFTKARAEEVTGRPLIYSFAGLYQGTNEVIHDLSWHEWLIDVNRLLRALDGPIRTHYGAETVGIFKKAIEDIAAGDVPAQNVFERGLNHTRTGATIAGLGWNLMTSLLQPIGLTQSMVRVGPGWVAKGMGQWIKAPLATVEEINSKSTMMASRAQTMQREINEIQNQVRGSKLDPVRSTFFVLIQKMQMVADVPTWLGAYEKAIAAGEAEERAVALADQAVLDAQGGGQMKDLSQIQRGHPALKLFTNFYSFFNVAYNLGVEKTKQKAGSPKLYPSLALDYLLLYTLPAALVTVMKDAILGGGDDDDELVKKIIADQISYLLGLMVGLREVTAAAQKVAGVEQFKGSYGGPAGLRLFQEIDKLGQQIGQGQADMAAFKAVNNVGGIVFHYPSGQINRSVEGVAALVEGKTANPLAVVVGPPKP